MFLAKFAFFRIEGAGFLSVILSGAKDLTILPDGRCRGRNGFLQALFFQLTLPDDDDTPALRLQLAPGLLISFLISGYFGSPEICVGLGDSVVGAVLVTMPKAAVNKDDSAILGENDVRLAGEALVVGAIAEAQVPEGMTQLQLRFCGSGVDM